MITDDLPLSALRRALIAALIAVLLLGLGLQALDAGYAAMPPPPDLPPGVVQMDGAQVHLLRALLAVWLPVLAGTLAMGMAIASLAGGASRWDLMALQALPLILVGQMIAGPLLSIVLMLMGVRWP